MAGDAPYRRIDVSRWPVRDAETGGADAKVWLDDDEGCSWLFKPVTDHGTWRQGEDWAEKAASHLAGLLEVPCAQVELAVYAGRPGAISRDLRPENHEMQHGAVLLAARSAPGYIPSSEIRILGDTTLLRRRPGHSLRNIRTALEGYLPPPDSSVPSDFTAFDVFAGYLVLDAWIGNRDRHDENWAVLHPLGTGPGRLCGSYDQAGSLGFNLQDAARSARLADVGGGGMRRFAERGDAWRFENQGRPVRSLVAHARDALDLASPSARAFWGEIIERLADLETAEIFSRIDTMSDPERRFACELLTINGRRLRDECRPRS